MARRTKEDKRVDDLLEEIDGQLDYLRDETLTLPHIQACLLIEVLKELRYQRKIQGA